MTGTRRVTTLVTREGTPDARFVLAWVQQTLRADNNPLIEAALAHANRRGLPLLIYHGLRQDYPHASARLHRFILGLSAEMSRALNQRGIRCIHYVERPGHEVHGLVYRRPSMQRQFLPTSISPLYRETSSPHLHRVSTPCACEKRRVRAA